MDELTPATGLSGKQMLAVFRQCEPVSRHESIEVASEGV